MSFRGGRAVTADSELSALLAARDRLVAQWEKEMACYRGGVTQIDDTVKAMNRASAETCRRFLANLTSLGSPAEPCLWRLVDEDADSYRTACGHLWEFTTGGPIENQAQFCPYCGRALTVGA